MRVYITVHGWLPDLAAGSERAMQHLVKPLVDRGDEVVVFATQSLGAPYDCEGARVIRGMPEIHTLDKPDIVLAHHLPGVVWGSLIADYFGVPLVNYLHNDRYDMDAMQACRPDFLVYNTHWVKEALKYGTPGMVVHPPLEAERHKTTPGDRVALINMQPNKGVDIFYRAAQDLPDVKFLAVQGTHGPQRLDGYHNVDVQLTVQDMREVWSQVFVLLMPSQYESYGMCAAEAAVSGIPTIAHPTPGLKECLGDSGIFIDRDDQDSYNKTISKLVSDKGYLAERSAIALERSHQLLSQSEKELSFWVETIPEILRRGRPPLSVSGEIEMRSSDGSVVTCNARVASQLSLWGWFRSR